MNLKVIKPIGKNNGVLQAANAKHARLKLYIKPHDLQGAVQGNNKLYTAERLPAPAFPRVVGSL